MESIFVFNLAIWYIFNMTTITIPKKLTKEGDLIVIARRAYEELLKRQKIVPVVKLTPSEKRAMERSRREMVRGRVFDA